MMLPSGNDAATALAIHFGGILKNKGTTNPEIVITDEAIDRRLRATKIVISRKFLEEKDRKRKQLLGLITANVESEDEESPGIKPNMVSTLMNCTQ